MSNNLTLSEAWERVVAKAEKDDNYRKQVIENPKSALANEGFTSADCFVVNADKNNKLSIQPQAASNELSTDDLKAIAGGQRTKLTGTTGG